MDNLNFSKIYEFDVGQSAPKFDLEMYLKEIGIKDFLFKVALKLDSYEKIFFEEQHYPSQLSQKHNTSHSKFVKEFEQEFIHGTGEKINYIIGIPGTGKSLFFSKGIKNLFISKTVIAGRYQEYCVHFKNVDQEKGIEFYKAYIYQNLKERAIDLLRNHNGSGVFDNFRKEYKKYVDDIDLLGETPHSRLFPTMYFCKHIHEKFGQPAIITFDDIDLSCETTQEQIRNAVASIHDELCNLLKSVNGLSWVRIFFVMRPETTMHTIEEQKGRRINFPYPDVLGITLDKLRAAVKETTKELGETQYSFGGSTLELESIIDGSAVVCTSIGDVADYFINIMEHLLLNEWNRHDVIERLGTSQEFHCYLVNYNVRTFFSFLADTLKDGGFKPFTERFVKNPRSIYTIFDYLEMLMRGRWVQHPGNQKISKEGRNFAPLVFNVFSSVNSGYSGTIEVQIKHFMLNIRIMQLFYYIAADSEIEYSKICKILELFFDKEKIDDATKKLIQVGILYSPIEGEKSIRSKKKHKDIKLSDDSCIAISDMGRFYLERLICEFEYLYQMALSSLMLDKHVEILKENTYEKEEVVYCFLDSIYHIKQINFNAYNNGDKKTYREFFLKSNDKAGRIYIRMIETFILAVEAKLKRAESISHAQRAEKLLRLSEKAQFLKERAIESFLAE